MKLHKMLPIHLCFNVHLHFSVGKRQTGYIGSILQTNFCSKNSRWDLHIPNVEFDDQWRFGSGDSGESGDSESGEVNKLTEITINVKLTRKPIMISLSGVLGNAVPSSERCRDWSVPGATSKDVNHCQSFIELQVSNRKNKEHN
jgi:hypothetical protein